MLDLFYVIAAISRIEPDHREGRLVVNGPLGISIPPWTSATQQTKLGAHRNALPRSGRIQR
jgi:hypothetical protein